jgi:hypothetical protein
MDAISMRLSRTYPETNEARRVEVSPLEREFQGEIRKTLRVLLAAVGFVLRPRLGDYRAPAWAEKVHSPFFRDC